MRYVRGTGRWGKTTPGAQITSAAVEITPEERRAILQFCRELFAISNLVASDFDDVQIEETDDGLHVFFVDWEAVGKAELEALEGLDDFRRRASAVARLRESTGDWEVGEYRKSGLFGTVFSRGA